MSCWSYALEFRACPLKMRLVKDRKRLLQEWTCKATLVIVCGGGASTRRRSRLYAKMDGPIEQGASNRQEDAVLETVDIVLEDVRLGLFL